MFDNIYITIMQDSIGNIADWFDENNTDEKRIIEERKKRYKLYCFTSNRIYRLHENASSKNVLYARSRY